MHRKAIATLVGITLLLALALPLASASGHGHVPPDFRRHQGTYWTWYGPKPWIDSQGPNDLVITSPVGKDMVHLGVSGAPCYQTPGAYYKDFRAYLKQSGAFYPKPLRSSKYTKVGKVRHLSVDATPYAWVQKVQFKGTKRSGGGGIRGEADLDYFYDQASNSCLQQFTIRSSLAEGYHDSIKTLRAITKPGNITSNGH
jgi:hypothetical protein